MNRPRKVAKPYTTEVVAEPATPEQRKRIAEEMAKLAKAGAK